MEWRVVRLTLQSHIKSICRSIRDLWTAPTHRADLSPLFSSSDPEEGP